MSRVLAYGLQFRPIRRLLGRIRWPRPDQLDRMTDQQLRRYIRSTGIEAEAQAILATYRRAANQSQVGSPVHQLGRPG